MVTELVRTAIATKCNYDNAKMTGNYECAYSLGMLSCIEGLDECAQITSLDIVYKEVMDNIDRVKTDDVKIKQLIKLLTDYELTSKFDKQMDELYHMGYADKGL